MGQHIKVSTPPPKPVMIFDGDCGFCRFWINRWHRASGDTIEYRASQESEMRRRFPEIPQSAYDNSVQFVDVNGTVYDGAEAVLRSRAVFGKTGFLWIYRNVPLAAAVFEWGYHFVATHRISFSKVNRLVFRQKT